MISILTIAAGFGIIAGFWLDYAAKTEMKAGRRWFIAIAIISAITFVILSITLGSSEDYWELLGACVFMACLAYTSYLKSL